MVAGHTQSQDLASAVAPEQKGCLMAKRKHQIMLREYVSPSPRTKRPAAGFYAGVDFSEYLKWDAINNSSLHPMVHGSPGEYRWALDNLREETTDLRLGRLCHLGKLEPANLLQRYWVFDDQEAVARVKEQRPEIKNAKATNEYKEMRAEAQAANRNKEEITQSELDVIVGIATRLSEDALTRDLLTGGMIELSWCRPMTVMGHKVWLKGRLDLVQEFWLLGDFKTCRDTDAQTIAKSIHTFGYHRQASFYQHAYAELGDGELLPFWGIFARKDRGYEVQAAPFDKDALELGHEQWRKAVEQIVKCRTSGRWPYREHPKTFGLPAWANQGEPLTIDGETI